MLHGSWWRAYRVLRVAWMACLLVLPDWAAAQLQIYPPFIFSTVQTAGGYQQGSSFGDMVSHYTDLGPPPRLEYASSSLLNLGVPVLVSDAEATGAGGARADTTLEYFFRVTGPLNVRVPIVIHVSGLSVGVSRAGGGVGSVASAESRMWITNDDAGQNTQDFSVFYDDHILDQFGAPLNSSNNFVTDTKLLTRANTDRVAVTLDTYALVISSYTNAVGKANAMIDPYVTIDPSFPDAALYSIVMSTGVSNSPPVPEPSAPLMLTAGLLGLALRRRHESASGRAQSRNTGRATSPSPVADPRARQSCC